MSIFEGNYSLIACTFIFLLPMLRNQCDKIYKRKTKCTKTVTSRLLIEFWIYSIFSLKCVEKCLKLLGTFCLKNYWIRFLIAIKIFISVVSLRKICIMTEICLHSVIRFSKYLFLRASSAGRDTSIESGGVREKISKFQLSSSWEVQTGR